MLLLCHCHVSRMNHLARSVPPPLQPSASIHEDQTHDTFKAILSLQAITESQLSQCTMPVKYGSFGLMSVKMLPLWHI